MRCADRVNGRGDLESANVFVRLGYRVIPNECEESLTSPMHVADSMANSRDSSRQLQAFGMTMR